MKVCPKCGQTYDDSWSICLHCSNVGRKRGGMILYVIAVIVILISIAILLTPINKITSYNRYWYTRRPPNPNKFITDSTTNIGMGATYAHAYNNRGFNNYKNGDFNQAISNFSKAIELIPNYVDAYYNRGLAYYSAEQYDKALADYKKAITFKPNDEEAYNNFVKYVSEKKTSDRANIRDEILGLFKEKTGFSEKK